MGEFEHDSKGFTHFYPDEDHSKLGYHRAKFHTIHYNYMERKFQKSERDYKRFLELTTKLEVEEDVLQIFFQKRFYEKTGKKIEVSKPKRRTDVCYPIRVPSKCRKNFGPDCCAFFGLSCSTEPLTSTPKHNSSSRKRLHVDVSPIRSNPTSSRSSSRSTSEDSPGPSSRPRPSKASSVPLLSPNLPEGSHDRSEGSASVCENKKCSTNWLNMF